MSYPLFCGKRWRGGFWFRIAGFGLWCASYRTTPPLFSERHGLLPIFFRSRSWRARALRPGAL